MRFAARFFLRFVSFLLIFAFLLPSFTSLVSAQTAQVTPSSIQTQNYPTQLPQATSPYAKPNIDQNVPQNMHTLVQYILVEMMIALGCQLSGIDLSNPTVPCLAPNPLTTKIGYAPEPTDGKIQIGGIMGIVGNGIATMYTPTVTTSDYTRYLANNFGLVKKTLAAPPKDAFEGFTPLLGLWEASRNIAYFLLILAFVFIGIGVMMRIQLDPRTVMTIQNQIPRVIIAIILITFSYSIAAIMADLMWASTYLVINTVTDATGDKQLQKCNGSAGPSISSLATESILSAPLSFVSNIYRDDDCAEPLSFGNGIFDVSKNVANNITGLQTDVIMAVFGLDPDASCSWNQGSNTSGGSALDYIPFVSQIRTAVGFISDPADIGDCIFYGPIGKVMGKFISAAWWIVVFVAMIITLIRIWFMLLKAYAYIFLYVILAPMFIVINLLPKRPLGMGRWLKVFFVNLAIFPVTVLMLLLSRAFMDMFDHGADKIFVPPLIGNPNHDEFGAIIAFATLLIIPGMYSLLREKMGLQDVKQTAIGGQTFGAARGGVAQPFRQGWKHLNWKDQYGNPIGPVARLKHGAWLKVGDVAGKTKGFRWLGKQIDRSEFVRQNYGRDTGYEKGWQHRQKYDDARARHDLAVTSAEEDLRRARISGTANPRILSDLTARVTQAQTQRTTFYDQFPDLETFAKEQDKAEKQRKKLPKKQEKARQLIQEYQPPLRQPHLHLLR